MKNPGPQPVSPEIIASWQRRLAVLHAQLNERRADEWAWLWQIRIEIIKYLLARYAGEGTDPPQAAWVGSESAETETHEPYGNRAATPPPWVPAGMGKGVRPPMELRTRLQNLADANRERLQLVQEFREACLAEQEALARWETLCKEQEEARWQNIREAQARWESLCTAQDESRRQYTRALTTVLTDRDLLRIADATISDDEVLAILNGQGQVD